MSTLVNAIERTLDRFTDLSHLIELLDWRACA